MQSYPRPFVEVLHLVKAWLSCFIIFFILILSAYFHTAVGQEIDQLRKFIPPSPTSSSLGKYASWPVSLYTGVPGISIPLYEVKAKGISMPITLNYHASGIKVSEIASWVGLGFSLDAGGMITRTIRGFPDDNGGYLELRNNYVDPENLSSANVPYPYRTDTDYLKRVMDGLDDSEPDYYTLNAMGRSYKLIMGKDKKVLTQPLSNLNIDYQIEGTLYAWSIILEDGTQLFFGDGETEHVINALAGDGGVTSAITTWYLYQIISNTGDKITLHYTDETVNESRIFSETDYQKIQSSSPLLTPRNYSFLPRMSSKVLSSIETEYETITFTPFTRSDLEGGHGLSEINVTSKATGNSVKKYKFIHELSAAVNGNNYHNENSTDYKFRMRLSELREVADNPVSDKIWSFEYNPIHLPSRNSYAQDYWGYFNGATSNETLLPFHPQFNPTTQKFGNREPDSVKLKAEILTKITYPTGGYSVFNYNANSIVERKAQYVTDHIDLSQSDPVEPFTIQKPQFVYLFLEGAFNADLGPDVTVASVVIRKSSDNSISSGITIKKKNLVGTNMYSSYLTAYLEPGSYTIELNVADITTVILVDANLTYQKFTGYANAQTLIGGVRIGSIWDYDQHTDKVIKRFFNYAKPFVINPVDQDDFLSRITTRSYTCILDPLNPGSGSGDPGVNNQLSWDDNDYYARYSGAKATLGSIQGGNVGYGKVTTLYGSPTGENGRTISYFSNEPDLHTEEAKIAPYIPVTDFSWRRGLLLEQQEYSREGTRLKRIVNNHDFLRATTFTAFKASYKFMKLTDCIFYEFIEQVALRKFYDITTELVSLNNSSEVNYFLNSSNVLDSMVSVTNYFYDTPDNFQATRIESINSKGESVKTLHRTAFEKALIHATTPLTTAASETIDQMRLRNMVSPVIQTLQYKNNKLITTVTTDYKIWYSNPVIIAPEFINTKNGSGANEKRLIFSKYDGRGNMMEQQKFNDVKFTYLYNYFFMYPVAEVTNADFNSIAYTSFEADSKGRWEFNIFSRDNAQAYTGKNSFILKQTDQLVISGLDNTRTYKVSLWASSEATVNVNGSIPASGEITNGWIYYEKIVTGETSVTISGSGNIDEVRLHPREAQMSTYTYEPGVGITSVTDTNNKTMYYVYDSLHRLRYIQDQKKNMVKSFEYNYQLR